MRPRQTQESQSPNSKKSPIYTDNQSHIRTKSKIGKVINFPKKTILYQDFDQNQSQNKENRQTPLKSARMHTENQKYIQNQQTLNAVNKQYSFHTQNNNLQKSQTYLDFKILKNGNNYQHYHNMNQQNVCKTNQSQNSISLLQKNQQQIVQNTSFISHRDNDSQKPTQSRIYTMPIECPPEDSQAKSAIEYINDLIKKKGLSLHQNLLSTEEKIDQKPLKGYHKSSSSQIIKNKDCLEVKTDRSYSKARGKQNSMGGNLTNIFDGKQISILQDQQNSKQKRDQDLNHFKNETMKINQQLNYQPTSKQDSQKPIYNINLSQTQFYNKQERSMTQSSDALLREKKPENVNSKPELSRKQMNQQKLPKNYIQTQPDDRKETEFEDKQSSSILMQQNIQRFVDELKNKYDILETQMLQSQCTDLYSENQQLKEQIVKSSSKNNLSISRQSSQVLQQRDTNSQHFSNQIVNIQLNSSQYQKTNQNSNQSSTMKTSIKNTITNNNSFIQQSTIKEMQSSITKALNLPYSIKNKY